MTRLLIFLIRAYQWVVSPVLPPSCRFHPSCSRYAAQALERHGVFGGLLLAAIRLAKCHPFHPGGMDPVPHTLRAGVPRRPAPQR